MDQSNDRTLVAVEVVDEKLRAQQLKAKQICRFCLTQDASLSSIIALQADNKSPKTPLTLQIMSCVAIEVHADDGMPGMICESCHVLINSYYQFKQICRNADTHLKSFLSTGVWPEKLTIPKELMTLVQNSKVSAQKVTPRSNKADVTPNSSPANDSDKEKKKKLNIIRLSPLDLENLRLGNRVTMTNPDTPPVAVRKTQQSHPSTMAPTHTSTPLPKRSPAEAANRNAASRGSQLHEPSQALAAKQRANPTKQKKDSNSPVILNKLASSRVQQPMEEDFVTTGDGTVEMILKYDPASPPATDPVFPCPDCNRTFKLKQLLDIHKINHTRERNYPCDLCTKRFFSKYDLAKHNTTHTGERPYVCVICRAAFSRSTLLTRHQASHKDDLTHPCMFCDRVFVSQEELVKHTQVHEKHRPFNCSYCPKSFAYKQGLDRHEVVHMKELPHKCEYCEMSFRTSGLLSRHLTAHAGSRPYPCRLCRKSFLLSHHLSRHLRGHNTTGQSAYKCTDCELTFTGKNELIYHSAKHAIQSLICPLCREKFEDADAVTKHIKLHASMVPYACDYCDLMYTSEQKLADHCQEQHVDELAYEWSEEQKLQLAQEEEDAHKVFEDRAPVEEVMVAAEEVDGNRLHADASPEPMEGHSVFLQEDENTTAVFVDQYGEEQLLETFEVTEYVEESPGVLAPSETTKKTHSVAPTSTKQPTVKLEPQPGVSRQRSIEDFYKRNQLAADKKAAQRNVSEMLKNLPKGVTIKRELSAGTFTGPGSSSRVSIKPLPAAEKNLIEPPVEKGAPPAKPLPKEGEKRKPGRPPKVLEQTKELREVKRETVDVPQVKIEPSKQAKAVLASSKPGPEKKSPPEGGLKRSGTMNFPKTRVGIDGRPKAAESSTINASARQSMQMVRRSYSVAGTKRSAEEDGAHDEAVPSKRPAPMRKTLNPSAPSAVSNTAQKVVAQQAGDNKTPGAVNMNVLRTLKRLPNNSDTPIGVPVEMNVGGQKIKMQKLTLSKNEALALQQTGKLKGKV